MTAMFETIFASTVLAICIALMFRLLVGPRRRYTIDAWARRAAQGTRLAALRIYHWRSSRQVARRVTESLSVPTIGIGAGPDVSGQVLVVYDMLDIYPGRKARFVKNFLEGAPSVKAGIEAYVKAVKAKTFPAPEHCF